MAQDPQSEKVTVGVIADIHGMLPEVPECDLLLIAGDTPPWLDHSRFWHRQWFEYDFTKWAERIPVKQIVGIAGNHDLHFAHPEGDRYARTLPWEYLRDQTFAYEGLKIHGMPWTPPFFDWAFMAEEDLIAFYMEQVPDDVDILLMHGPPRGILDQVGGTPIWNEARRAWMTDPVRSVGSAAVRDALPRFKQLKLVVFGHIHNPGIEVVDDVTFINATRVNHEYKPIYDVQVVEIQGEEQ